MSRTCLFDSKDSKRQFSFDVPPDLFNSEKNAECNQKQFIMSSARDITNIHFWIRCSNYASRILIILPKPVTDYSIVYTVMLNVVKIANQLYHKILPVYCDESTFGILIDIYLQRQKQFKAVIPVLGRFHKAKCLEDCIGKYNEETRIDRWLSISSKICWC